MHCERIKTRYVIVYNVALRYWCYGDSYVMSEMSGQWRDLLAPIVGLDIPGRRELSSRLASVVLCASLAHSSLLS